MFTAVPRFLVSEIYCRHGAAVCKSKQYSGDARHSQQIFTAQLSWDHECHKHQEQTHLFKRVFVFDIHKSSIYHLMLDHIECVLNT